MTSKQKIIAGVAAGAAAALITGLVIWRSRKRLALAALKYEVDPLYKAPAGLKTLKLRSVPKAAVVAVRKIHGKFKLHQAFRDTDAMYLVEIHEGFDPLVFRVRRKT